MSTKITVDNIANNSVGITQLNVSDGSNGQFLTTDGAGNLSFSSLGTLTTLTVDDITIDGSTISDSGTLLIDVGGNIELDADGGQVYFKDNGLTGLIVSRESTSIDLHNATTNSDFKFKGSDDGSNITALTLDMSEAGKATFNAGASFSHDVTIDADDRALRIGAGQDLALFHDATDSTMRSSTGDFIISNTAQDKDILFKGNDAGSTITALTLDISEAGRAIFNAGANFGTTSSSAHTVQIQATTGGNALQLKGRNAAENAGWLAWTDYAGNVEAAMYATANQLIFANTTSYTETMRIDSSGNVGVGTTSPNRNLQIGDNTGSIAALSLQGSTSSNCQIYFGDNSATSAEYAGLIRYQHSTDSMQFWTSSSERMRINSSGQVGIACTDQSNLLTVDANSASTTTDSISVRNRGVTSANHTAGLRFQFNSAVPSAIRTLLTNTSSGAGTLSFFTSSDGSAGNLSERMLIDSSGSTQLKGYVGYGNYSATGSDTSQLIGVGARQRAMGGRGGQPNLLSWDTLDRSNSAYDDGSPINTFVSAYGVSFTPTGGSGTNTWILGEGPGGGIQWLWKGASTNPGNAGGQGGWDCSSFQIDTTYSYMLVNYVKRISSAATGTYYFGTQGVYNSGGGGLNNPYMTIRGTTHLPQGVWCCDVQFIVSHQYTGNVATQNTGLFRMDTGAPIQTWSGQFSGVNQYRSYPSSTNTHSIGFRTYLYYATANDGTTLHWAQPAVYKCDGTEPTLGELRGHRDARANNNV